MMERRVPGLWLGTSTTDELVICLKKWQGGEEKDCATEVSWTQLEGHDVDNIKGRPKCDLHV